MCQCLNFALTVPKCNTCIYRIAGLFRGRKLSRISRFCGDLREVFVYFQAIRHRASGRGTLRYKFANVFSSKICFQEIRKSSPVKETRYTVYSGRVVHIIIY